MEIDFKKLKIKKRDEALASLGVLAKNEKVLNKPMLEAAVKLRFNENCLKLPWQR